MDLVGSGKSSRDPDIDPKYNSPYYGDPHYGHFRDGHFEHITPIYYSSFM